MNRKAIELFRQEINCAQSVLIASSDEFDIEKDLALKIAAGFGGGLGKKQLTCGAITGGIMTLGLKYHNPENHEDSKKVSYLETRKLIDAFEKEFDCTSCRELLGVDVMTEEGKMIMKQENYRHTKCEKYIAFVMDYLEKL